MDRLPRQGERLVRESDAKRFEVAHVTTVEGGLLSFALRSEGGERAIVCVDELFPPSGPQPYRFAE